MGNGLVDDEDAWTAIDAAELDPDASPPSGSYAGDTPDYMMPDTQQVLPPEDIDIRRFVAHQRKHRRVRHEEVLLEMRSTIRTTSQPTLSTLTHSLSRLKSGENCVEDSKKRRVQKLKKSRAQAAVEAYQPHMSTTKRATSKSDTSDVCFTSVYTPPAECGICSRAGQ